MKKKWKLVAKSGPRPGWVVQKKFSTRFGAKWFRWMYVAVMSVFTEDFCDEFEIVEDK